MKLVQSVRTRFARYKYAEEQPGKGSAETEQSKKWASSTRIVLVATGAITLVATLSLLGWCWTGGERDHLAAWVEAVSTTAAFVAAAIAAVYAAGAFRLEAAREQRWDDSTMRAQAEVVAAWGTRGVVTVVNGSPLPIYEVQIIVSIREKFQTQRYGYIEPTGVEGRTLRAKNFLQLFDEQRQEATLASRKRPRTNVTIEFSDAAGQRWIRDRKGKLSRQASPSR